MEALERLRRRLSRLEEEFDDERDPEERRVLRRQIRKLEDRIDEAEESSGNGGPPEDAGVFVLSGAAAESFLSRFGLSDEGEGEEGEGEEGEGEEGEGDDQPDKGPRYFGGKGAKK